LGSAVRGAPGGGVSLKDRLADIERDLISQALTRTDGNVSQTARLLSLQRTTLIEKNSQVRFASCERRQRVHAFGLIAF